MRIHISLEITLQNTEDSWIFYPDDGSIVVLEGQGSNWKARFPECTARFLPCHGVFGSGLKVNSSMVFRETNGNSGKNKYVSSQIPFLKPKQCFLYAFCGGISEKFIRSQNQNTPNISFVLGDRCEHTRSNNDIYVDPKHNNLAFVYETWLCLERTYPTTLTETPGIKSQVSSLHGILALYYSVPMCAYITLDHSGKHI